MVFGVVVRGLALLLLAVWLGGCAADEASTAVVERVIDGDTLVLESGETVRLIGVDAPEIAKDGRPGQPYSQRAKAFVRRLAEGKTVRLERDAQERDRYGRLLAYVYLPDGSMLNERLLAEGYALQMTIPPNVRYAERLLAAERRARDEKRGLWQTREIDRPYVDRHGRGLIKGNVNARGEKVYHLPGSRYYGEVRAEAWFRTEREALDAGFRPARTEER